MQKHNSRFFNSSEQNYTRNAEAKQLIEEAFAALAATIPTYVFTGSESYGFVIDRCRLNSEQILAQAYQSAQTDLSTEPARVTEAVRVLDVGAGDFSFVDINQEKYSPKIELSGISATDVFRRPSSRITDKRHIINNAEFLNRHYDSGFDYIFSHMTFLHFSDPIGSFIEAYKALKPGGILAIDEFPIRGCEALANYIILYLQENGYKVIANSHPTKIGDILISKPHDGSLPELKFPVLFDRIEDGKLYYRPTQDLLQKLDSLIQKAKENESQCYASGCAITINDARKINEGLFNRCNSLPDLFRDAEYQQLTILKHQHLFIRAIIAKTKPYSELNSIYRLCKQNDVDEFFEDVTNDVFTRPCYLYADSPTIVGFHLEQANDNPDIKMAMCEQVIRIITYAAMTGIILDQKRVDTKTKLESMHIPVSLQDTGLEHYEDLRIKAGQTALNFSKLIAAFDQDDLPVIDNTL